MKRTSRIAAHEKAPVLGCKTGALLLSRRIDWLSMPVASPPEPCRLSVAGSVAQPGKGPTALRPRKLRRGRSVVKSDVRRSLTPSQGTPVRRPWRALVPLIRTQKPFARVENGNGCFPARKPSPILGDGRRANVLANCGEIGRDPSAACRSIGAVLLTSSRYFAAASVRRRSARACLARRHTSA